MKKFKKPLSVFLSLLMILPLFAGREISVFAETDGMLTYEINSGEVTITGCDTAASGALRIPDAIQGYPVTSIASRAFEYCRSLTSVTIPDSVTRIGSNAFFNCSALTSVIIPDSVTDIGFSAFYNCSALTSVTIPDSVTSIGSDAFYNCQALTGITVDSGNVSYSSDKDGVLFNKEKTELIQYPIGNTGTAYAIPNSVTDISANAFYNGITLTSVTIPDSVTTIGEDAFYNCRLLTNVTMSNGVESIGDDAFFHTGYYNELSNWENGVLYIGNWLLEAKTSLYGSYAIKDGTKGIADSAFYNCNSLTSVEIPDGLTKIGSYAFYNNKSLTEAVIPKSVTAVEDYAFQYCDALTDVYYSGSETDWAAVSIGYKNDVFASCVIHYNDVRVLGSGTYGDVHWSLSKKGVLTISGTGDMKAVYNSSSVAWNAYRDSILSVVIQPGVTSITAYAFRNCVNLTAVTIPSSLTAIGDYAFSGCTGLTDLTLPDGVTAIGSSAFSDCTGLTALTIPSSVTSLGSNLFSGCTALTEITAEPGNPIYTSVDGVLFSADGATLISYPSGRISDYEVPACVTAIGEGAFRGSAGLTNITIPIGITSVGSYAFSNCDSLTNVFYGGRQKDWEMISIDGNNTCLTNAVIHYSDGSCTVLSADSAVVPVSTQSGTRYDSNGYRVIPVGEQISLSAGTAHSTIVSSGWNSSNSNIVKIASSSLNTCYVQAVRAGTCTITYDGSSSYQLYDQLSHKYLTMVDTDKAVFKIRVIKEISAISWNETALTLAAGDSTALTYTLSPDSSCSEALIALTYGSSNTDVAVIDRNGTVTAVHAGTAILTARTSNGLEATCQITVTGNNPDPENPDNNGDTDPIPENPGDGTPAAGPNTETPSGSNPDPENPDNSGDTDPIPGNPGDGPSAADPNTENPSAGTPAKTDPVLTVRNDTIVLDHENGSITLNPQICAKEVSAQTESGLLNLIDAQGNALSPDSFIGTGCILQLLDAKGNGITEYTVIVLRDVDGDGKITAADARLALRAAAKLDAIEGVYFTAADENGDGVLNAADARKILRKAANLE